MMKKSDTFVFPIVLEPGRKTVIYVFIFNHEDATVEVTIRTTPDPLETSAFATEFGHEGGSAQFFNPANPLLPQQEQPSSLSRCFEDAEPAPELSPDEDLWFSEGGSAQMFNPRATF